MSEALKVPIMADMMTAGTTPDILFWVGSAGSFDDRVCLPRMDYNSMAFNI